MRGEARARCEGKEGRWVREAWGRPYAPHLERLGLESELDREVVAVDPRLEALDVAADVGLALEQPAVVHRARVVLLLVRADHVGGERLDHQQTLAQRARPLAQHLVGRHRDDRAQREDEAVDVPVAGDAGREIWGVRSGVT